MAESTPKPGTMLLMLMTPPLSCPLSNMPSKPCRSTTAVLWIPSRQRGCFWDASTRIQLRNSVEHPVPQVPLALFLLPLSPAFSALRSSQASSSRSSPTTSQPSSSASSLSFLAAPFLPFISLGRRGNSVVDVLGAEVYGSKNGAATVARVSERCASAAEYAIAAANSCSGRMGRLWRGSVIWASWITPSPRGLRGVLGRPKSPPNALPYALNWASCIRALVSKVGRGLLVDATHQFGIQGS